MTRTKFRTQDPQFSHHHTKFSRPGHLARCICVPLVSALRVGQVCDVISPSLIAASWTPSRYVVSLSCSVKASPDSPPVRLNPVCWAVPFCQPFVITCHSTWLFTVAEYSCRTTAVLQRSFVSTNVPSTNCAWPAVCSDCMCYVRRCGNLMTEMCFCCGSTESRRGD